MFCKLGHVTYTPPNIVLDVIYSSSLEFPWNRIGYASHILLSNSQVASSGLRCFHCTFTYPMVWFRSVISGSVQEDGGPLRCNPSFQKQHHVTKKYINPSLTQLLVWFNPSLTCHGTCRIGRKIAHVLYNYKTRSRYAVIKRVCDF